MIGIGKDAVGIPKFFPTFLSQIFVYNVWYHKVLNRSNDIQQKNHSFKISVSHTTRTPRSNEIDGVDYFFVSKLVRASMVEIVKQEAETGIEASQA